MYKVLLVSDNHRLTQELTLIKQRHRVNEMIHCGDSELPYDAIEMEMFHKVKGNCDLDPSYPDELIVEIAGLRFLIVHGHQHQVNRDLSVLSYAAEEKQADVICYGHTHIARKDSINGKIFINPGSIAQSRSEETETYAILEWDTLDNFQVSYYDVVTGARVEALDFQ